MLRLWVQMRDSCDPWGVSDGSKAGDIANSSYRVPFFVLHACFVFAPCLRFYFLGSLRVSASYICVSILDDVY